MEEAVDRELKAPRGASRNARGGRRRGRNRRRAKTDDSSPAAPIPDGTIKVGSDSDTRKVAGSICHQLRDLSDGGSIHVGAVGRNAVNQAVKALAIATRYLASDDPAMCMSIVPIFDGGDERPDQLTMTVTAEELDDGSYDTVLTGKELTSSNKWWNLAGAIAGRLRDGDAVAVLSKGGTMVLNTMRAIDRATQYLGEDEDQDTDEELSFTPSFVEVPFERRSGSKEGEEVMSTYLHCAVHIAGSKQETRTKAIGRVVRSKAPTSTRRVHKPVPKKAKLNTTFPLLGSELGKLAALWQQGLLNDAEFSAAKAQLLAPGRNQRN